MGYGVRVLFSLRTSRRILVSMTLWFQELETCMIGRGSHPQMHLLEVAGGIVVGSLQRTYILGTSPTGVGAYPRGTPRRNIERLQRLQRLRSYASL